MTTVADALPTTPRRPSITRRLASWISVHVLGAISILVLAYLLLPILVIALFSFNDPAGKFNFTWQGFTLDHWLKPFGVPGLQDAILTSFKIAVLASLVATILGTLIGLALVRYKFFARGSTNSLIFMAITTPEIVLGASLLALFLNIGVARGFWTIFVAHVMFNISFVVVVMKARLVGFDRHLEEASMDLGANEWSTFIRITLPLIAPGILAAALLAFALSIDDFIITNFNAGAELTFPMFVWGAARVGVPPQVNVIGTMLFLAAVFIIVVNIVVQSLRGRRAAQWERQMQGA